MAITYTWQITGLKTKNVSDDKPAAVVQTYWKKIGIDADGNEGTFSGATPFTVDPTDESGPFIAFEDLTEENVLDWIKTVVVGGYEQHVNEQITKQIEQKINPVTENTLPWAPVTANTPAPDMSANTAG
jgi:methanogenic corrinoid protein MtbC1